MSTIDPVEHHLEQLSITTANFKQGDESKAIAHAFAAVRGINQAISPQSTGTDATSSTPLALGESDLVGKLQKWLDRLLAGVRELVQKLVGALTFSLSVGTTVSLTVNFDGKDVTGGAGSPTSSVS